MPLAPPRGRYAPSPTGLLHLGNARTALLAWLHIRALGGVFVLRSEDIDTSRSRPEAQAANVQELRWLGLDWDEGPDVGGRFAPYVQSQRDGYYAAALEHLQPHLFPCYLSRKDLQSIASAPHGRSSVYGNAQRQANARLAARKQAEGKTPSLRLRVPDDRVCVDDAVAGRHCWSLAEELGDVVLRRADGMWAYHLAVVVDDIAMNISHVLRADDLLPSTAAHLLLYRMLGQRPPRYSHVPLLLDQDGQRMAKRHGALTLQALQQRGVPAARVVGWLAYSAGLLERPQPCRPYELLPSFRLEALRLQPYRFSEADWRWLLATRSGEN